MRLLNSFVIVCILVCSSSAGIADDTQMAAAFKHYMAAPDSPVILRGDYFKASLVAYRDFAKILASRARSDDSKNATSSPNLSDIQNYNISIDQTSSSIIVQLGPGTRDPSYVVFGGGAHYVIDRATFKILDRTLLK